MITEQPCLAFWFPSWPCLSTSPAVPPPCESPPDPDTPLSLGLTSVPSPFHPFSPLLPSQLSAFASWSLRSSATLRRFLGTRRPGGGDGTPSEQRRNSEVVSSKAEPALRSSQKSIRLQNMPNNSRVLLFGYSILPPANPCKDGIELIHYLPF